MHSHLGSLIILDLGSRIAFVLKASIADLNFKLNIQKLLATIQVCAKDARLLHIKIIGYASIIHFTDYNCSRILTKSWYIL